MNCMKAYDSLNACKSWNCSMNFFIIGFLCINTFEDTKEVTRSRNSKQWYGQRLNEQNKHWSNKYYTEKQTIEQHEPH